MGAFRVSLVFYRLFILFCTHLDVIEYFYDLVCILHGIFFAFANSSALLFLNL